MSRTLIEKWRKERDSHRATAVALLDRMEAGEELSETDQAILADAQRDAEKLDTKIGNLTEIETNRLRSEQRDHALNGMYAAAEHVVPPAASRRADFAAAAAEALIGLRSTTGVVSVQMAVIDNRDPDGTHIAGVTRVRDAAEPRTVTPLLDVVAHERVNSDDYEWEKWGLLPVAGTVARAEGSAKPEADDGYVIVKGVLDTAAHHIGVSRRALQDRPGLEDKLRGRLTRGVQLAAEGYATAALLGGTYATATHADGLLQAIRVGIAKVQDLGYNPDTVVVNPLDLAEFDILLLSKTLNGAQRGISAWQLPNVVPKSGVPQGTAYVGNAFDALLCTYRADVELYMTDSHAEEFTKNRLRILAEQRVSVNLQQPNALVKCSVA